MNSNENYPKIGDIYLMFFYGKGSAQRGWRPGLVIQNNVGNIYSPNIVALPLTTNLKNTAQPTHVILSSSDTGLRTDSMVLCESPMSIPKDMIGKFITSVSKDQMKSIAKAFVLEFPVLCYLDYKNISYIIEESSSLIVA